jgi:predicted glycogen debranching enzyme
VPYPRWAYQANGFTVQKELRLLQGESTVLLSYTLLASAEPVDLEVRPLFALRGIHELMHQWSASLAAQNLSKHHHRLPATSRTPEVFFAHNGSFTSQSSWYLNTTYRRELERGYEGLEDLWMPGVIRFTLRPGRTVHFVCSTEPIDLKRVVADAERQYEAAVPAIPTPRPDGDLEALLRAAEQFVVHSTDPGTGLNTPAVIAAYPWSPPLGRDALICLPGLLLATGRMDDARGVLAAFASTLKNGLMPSAWGEDGSGPRYHAADTSLWFIYAVGQYLRYGGDEAFVSSVCLPVIHNIIEAYRRDAALGIVIDADGLLRCGSAGTPVTWMDAKTGDHVVTPRHGYPVSINALWYNALRTAAQLSGRFGQGERVDELNCVASRTQAAFNRRFWNAQADCLYDVLGDRADGSDHDASIRPNQLFAVSLPHAVLDPVLHERVLSTVRRHLLTPVGLRTLAPSSRDYRGAYAGGPADRDRALHQGSVFPWLLGPFVTAFLKVYGRGDEQRQHARALLDGCFRHLSDRGVGQVAELFDGEPPHNPGGAPASARSVAELLRAYVEDVLNLTPASMPGRSPLRLPERDGVPNM